MSRVDISSIVHNPTNHPATIIKFKAMIGDDGKYHRIGDKNHIIAEPFYEIAISERHLEHIKALNEYRGVNHEGFNNLYRSFKDRTISRENSLTQEECYIIYDFMLDDLINVN